MITRLYVCNRKKCKNCYDECYHTRDLSFAKYKEHTSFTISESGDFEVEDIREMEEKA